MILIFQKNLRIHSDALNYLDCLSYFNQRKDFLNIIFEHQYSNRIINLEYIN